MVAARAQISSRINSRATAIGRPLPIKLYGHTCESDVAEHVAAVDLHLNRGGELLHCLQNPRFTGLRYFLPYRLGGSMHQ